MSKRWLSSALRDGATAIFGSVEGSSIFDQGPSKHSGTLYNNTESARSQIHDERLRPVVLNGSNNYGDVALSGQLITDVAPVDTYSVEAIISPDLHSGADGTICDWGFSTNKFMMAVQNANSSTTMRLAVHCVVDPFTAVDCSGYSPDGSLVPSHIHHVVYTWSETGAAKKIYIDGLEVSVTTNVPSISAGNLLTIGRRGTGADRYFQGRLGPLTFYAGTVLTESQIRNHHRLALTREQVVGTRRRDRKRVLRVMAS